MAMRRTFGGSSTMRPTCFSLKLLHWTWSISQIRLAGWLMVVYQRLTPLEGLVDSTPSTAGRRCNISSPLVLSNHLLSKKLISRYGISHFEMKMYCSTFYPLPNSPQLTWFQSGQTRIYVRATADDIWWFQRDPGFRESLPSLLTIS